MTKVISILSRETAVGKSVSLVNLSTWLAFMGHSVLIIDTSFAGNVFNYLSCKRPDKRQSLYSVLTSSLALDDSLTKSTVKNLDIMGLPDLSPQDKDNYLESFENDPYLLRDAIDLLEMEYEFIFIDTPTNYLSIDIGSLVASDSVIIPLKCNQKGLESIPNIIETVTRIKDSLNKWLKIEGILVTGHDHSDSFSREILTLAKSRFPKLLFRSLIPQSNTIKEACESGQPLVLFDNKSFACEAYLRLSREFI